MIPEWAWIALTIASVGACLGGVWLGHRIVRSVRRLREPLPSMVTFVWQVEGLVVQVVGSPKWTIEQVRDAVLYDLPQRLPAAQARELALLVQYILRNEPTILRSDA